MQSLTTFHEAWLCLDYYQCGSFNVAAQLSTRLGVTFPIMMANNMEQHQPLDYASAWEESFIEPAIINVPNGPNILYEHTRWDQTETKKKKLMNIM